MKSINIHNKLLNQCKKGNSKAQFEIYKLYYKAMYNVSLRIVQNINDAEDVMQDSFLSAFSKLNYWSQEVAFGAWLKKIVINKSLDLLKKKKLETVDIDERLNVLDDNIENSEEQIQIKIDVIKQIVSELPEKYRNVTTLFLFEGLTHNEISEILEIKPETSRIRFMRAKELIVKVPELNKQFNDVFLN
jgi:RNA polymerase sigma-70 factor (ECF subfamily)